MFYTSEPLVKGNRATPIPVSIGGIEYFEYREFLVIYFVQMVHAVCVVMVLCSYDGIFIQIIMQITIQFKILRETLGELLRDCQSATTAEDRDQAEVLIHVSKLHISVLRWVFSSCVQAE